MNTSEILKKMAKGKRLTWGEKRYLVENNFAEFKADTRGKIMILNSNGREILYRFYK